MIEEDKTLPVCYRLAADNDRNFIFSAWKSSERYNDSSALTPNSIYNEEMQHKINYLLSRCNTMIAYLEDEPDTILGFCTYQYINDHLVIHYAFTKSIVRKQGIQRQMLSLINILNQHIVLTAAIDKSMLFRLQQKHAIIYDYFYFQRKFYNDN